MGHFYGTVQGNRGETSRTGSKNSGIKGHLRGWKSGVRIVGQYNNEKEQDEFIVYATFGSDGEKNKLPEIEIGKIIDGRFFKKE